MYPINLCDIISFIRPNSEFVITDNDISTLVFHSNHTIPSENEIEEGQKNLENDLKIQQTAKLAQKAALLEKLGITEDEARLLLS